MSSNTTPSDAVNAAIAATSTREGDLLKRHRASTRQGPRQQIASTILFAQKHFGMGTVDDDTATISEGSKHTSSAMLDKHNPADISGVKPTAYEKQSKERQTPIRKSTLLSPSNPGQKPSEHRPLVVGRKDFEQTVSASDDLELPPSPYAKAQPAPLQEEGNKAYVSAAMRVLPIPPPVPMVTHPVHGDPSKILAATDAKESFPLELKPRPFVATLSSTASTTDDESINSYPIFETITSPQLRLANRDAENYFSTSFSAPLHLSFPSSISNCNGKTSNVPKSRSPLGSLPPSVPSSPPLHTDWDYSETRWWGWFILVVTWMVFVVGIGSCFGIWSWAWDVGETPYAPPELEDDPTLPIVGYYPALIVLTCVMAWVWVTSAWVGMKYFRHANISGDDR